MFKLEITSVNKERFILSHCLNNKCTYGFNDEYRGTIIGNDHRFGIEIFNPRKVISAIHEFCRIELVTAHKHSLDEITAEDLIQIGDIVHQKPQLKESTRQGLGLSIIDTFLDRGINYLSVPCYQYLEFKQYALPWNGISVEELEKNEWITIQPK